MSTSYIGEIRMFAGNFAPQGWMLCNGQLLPISENDTLYSLIGTIYGGDGMTTFALPDLRGRSPMSVKRSGAPSYVVGEAVGAESVTVTSAQLPAHQHTPLAAPVATSPDPAGSSWARWHDVPYTNAAPDVDLHPSALAPSGGSQPHENRSPYLAINFIIALYGIYPSRP